MGLLFMTFDHPMAWLSDALGLFCLTWPQSIGPEPGFLPEQVCGDPASRMCRLHPSGAEGDQWEISGAEPAEPAEPRAMKHGLLGRCSGIHWIHRNTVFLGPRCGMSEVYWTRCSIWWHLVACSFCFFCRGSISMAGSSQVVELEPGLPWKTAQQWEETGEAGWRLSYDALSDGSFG